MNTTKMWAFQTGLLGEEAVHAVILDLRTITMSLRSAWATERDTISKQEQQQRPTKYHHVCICVDLYTFAY